MSNWIPQLEELPGPRYRALAESIARAIDSGRLRPGDRLPTQRDLADRLGLAVTTVTRGYAEAERHGLLRGEVGRGTFVRPRTSPSGEVDAGGPIDLRTNFLLPSGRIPELLASAARVATTDDPIELAGYGPHRGRRRHREAAASWMERGGLATSPEQVVVVGGGQHGLHVVLSVLTEPGDTLLTEEVTYGGLKALARLLRIRLEPLPLDDEGIRPEALEKALERGGARALYCVPTFQNPTTVVMSERRRRAIAELADTHGVVVVEDNTYGFALPEVTPLAAYSPNAVHVASTSKSLLPTLRVGYVRAPVGRVPRLEAVVSSTLGLTSPLLAAVATAWLEDGTADQVMAWKREQFAARQAMAARALGTHGYRSHPRSPHGWLRLPEPWTAREFVAQAEERGVVLSPAEEFSVGRAPAPHAVRFGLGPTAGIADLERALAVVADLVDEAPSPTTTVA